MREIMRLQKGIVFSAYTGGVVAAFLGRSAGASDPVRTLAYAVGNTRLRLRATLFSSLAFAFLAVGQPAIPSCAFAQDAPPAAVLRLAPLTLTATQTAAGGRTWDSNEWDYADSRLSAFSRFGSLLQKLETDKTQLAPQRAASIYSAGTATIATDYDDDEEVSRQARRAARSQLARYADDVLDASKLRATYRQAKEMMRGAGELVTVKPEQVQLGGPQQAVDQPPGNEVSSMINNSESQSYQGPDTPDSAPLFTAGIDLSRGATPVIKAGRHCKLRLNPLEDQYQFEVQIGF